MLIGIDASRATHARRTGTESYSLHLIRALLAEDSAHHFRLYFRDAPPPDMFPTAGRVEHQIITMPRLWSHIGLRRAILRDRPDVLFVPSHVIPWPDTGDVPAVITIHDLGYRYFPQAHSLWQRLYLDWSTRHSCRAASRIIAVSQATARDLTSLYRVSSSKIVVIHSGFDDQLKRVDNQESILAVKHRMGIGGSYILHVGSIHPRKNLVRLVEAFAAIKDMAPGLSLVLAGQPGRGYDGLMARIGALKLSGRVMLPGYVRDADLSALYSGAMLYIFPSLHEGFGFPALEAMACGVPVAAANTSSLPEICGDAALLFPPEDVGAMARAIKEAVTSDTLRSELVQRGYQQVKKFSWKSAARAILVALEAAANRKYPTIN